MLQKLELDWNSSIWIKKIWDDDYLCITDMASSYWSEDAIKNWMKNKDTLEYLWTRETDYNDNFNVSWYQEIWNNAWTWRFLMSPQKRITSTNAVWIISKSWKWWWTYAHIDIALEFASHLNPSLKVFITKDYKRLKKLEQDKVNSWRNQARELTKMNYSIMTDAVKNKLIPKEIDKNKIHLIYAEEADLINVALFNMTAWEWRSKNSEKAKKWENIRENISVEQLNILFNLEFKNSELIKEWISQKERLEILNKIAIEQITKFINNNIIRTRKQLPKYL